MEIISSRYFGADLRCVSCWSFETQNVLILIASHRTIYGSDIAFCSSSKLSVASFGACVTNTTVNQFSVDCADYQIATSDAPASYVSAAPSRTASPVAPSSSAAAATTGLSTGAKVGIGAGIAAVILLLIALGMWLIIRRRRKARQNQEPAPPMGELSGNAGFPVEAPPGYSEETKLGHDRKAPRVANQEPVEAMGDVHWRGGVHEMESPSVTTGTMSSEGWRSQRG